MMSRDGPIVREDTMARNDAMTRDDTFIISWEDIGIVLRDAPASWCRSQGTQRALAAFDRWPGVGGFLRAPG